MRAPRITLLVLAVLVLVGAPAGYAVYWYAMSDRVRAGIERWAAERRAEGYTVQYQAIERAGFPFALELRMPDPQLARGSDALAWRADVLSASARPWDLQDITVEFPGRHAVTLPIDGKPRPIRATLETGRLDLLLDGRGRWRALATNLSALDARFSDTGEPFRVGSARIVLQRSRAQTPTAVSLASDARIDGLMLPPERAGPLGPNVDLIRLLADVIGEAPASNTAAAMAAWRDAGGHVAIKEFQLNWGRVEIRGAGTARLDPNLQAEVRLDAQMRGWDALIDALVMRGQLKVTEAILAKGALAVLARPADDGGPPALRVAISVRDGNRVYLGPIRIWRLPPLQWR
ncbi:MAG: DUF2125 domain-containing protein [Alphaproteobacteria bacterium]|nr:DUF2125 domain-containing protein [Alphaproteobacteria bacterium]